MNQPRYNTFNQIHKGLRVLLYETATHLQQADLSDPVSGADAVEQVNEVVYLFDSHAHGEDQFFNEPLEKIDPKVSQLFVKEHEEDHRLSLVLTDLISQWRAENTADGRANTGRNLLYAFNEFIAFNLYHMNKEEIELNGVLWKHYSDTQIKQVEQTLVQQIPPQKMAIYAKWMIRGINDEELFHWLNEVRMFAPMEVYNMLMGIGKEQLAETRFDTLQERLNRIAKHQPA